MKKNLIRAYPLLLVIVMFSIGYSTTVKHYNLKDMISKSERIFVGKCMSVAEAELKFPKGSIWYTEYTFQVSETIKGQLGPTVTFRQYGLSKPKKINETIMLYNRPIGMPAYEADQEYVLFLMGDSELGLTGPIGLYQGAFLVHTNEFNQKVVVNGAQNRGLFLRTTDSELRRFDFSESEEKLVSSKSGPFVLDNFVSVVKRFAQIY